MLRAYIALLIENNNNNVIDIGYYGVLNGLIPWAFTRPLKPHNTLYRERYYYTIFFLTYCIIL